MGFEFSSVFQKFQMLFTSDDALGVSINQFVALASPCLMIDHLIEDNPWMNQSMTALCIGLCTGIVLLVFSGGKSSQQLVFSEDISSTYLLPIIIFNAGFQVKKKQFFVYFIPLVLLAPVGTLTVCCGLIIFGLTPIFKRMGISTLAAIGAIFAAFLGIALHVFSNFLYLCLTSAALGTVTGLLSAYIIKKLYIGRHSTDREFALMMLMAYMSYMLAELCYLSGILSVFFCGIIMSRFTWPNVTEGSRITAQHTFATLSFVVETPIFLCVVLDALDIEWWRFVSESPGTSVAVSPVLLILLLVGRAAFVFLLSFLSTLVKRSPNRKVYFRQKVIICWVVLMRGVFSMALAYSKFTLSGLTQLRSDAITITSSITLVLSCTVLCYLSGILSVFFCGIVMSHYTWHNVTEGSRITTKHASATLSFVAETFIFLYVGKDALDIETWFVSDSPGTSAAVTSVLLGLVLSGRATSVFPLSFLSNLAKKSPNEKISFRQQVIIRWARLMRVVLSMALACNQFTLSGHTIAIQCNHDHRLNHCCALLHSGVWIVDISS